MSRSDSLQAPTRLRPLVAEITARTDAIAREHLDEEYAELARRMTAALSRMRPSPIERGDARSWAAGVLDAIGWVNFLSDAEQEPHMTAKQLAAAAGVSKNTMSARSRAIREALGILLMDPDWTRPSGLLDNPLVWIVPFEEGMLDLRDAPRAVQEDAFEAGIIPFVPANRIKPVTGHDPFDLGQFAARPSTTIGAKDEDDEDDLLFETSPPIPGGNLADPLAQMREAVQRALEANPDATIDEVNAALSVASDAYNLRPQDELGGLSPQDMHALFSADWRTGNGAIRLAESLTLAELDGAPLLHHARLLMSMLAERDKVKATAIGNLPREFVHAFRERMRPEEEWNSLDFERAPQKETDLFPLHRARTMLSIAGIVRFAKGNFHLTRKGRTLAADDRAGELLATLVHTQFRRMNLAWHDGLPDVPELQHTIAYPLWRIAQAGYEWRTPGDLVHDVLLPIVLDAIPPPPPAFPDFDEPALMLELRVLLPLLSFGMVEARAPVGSPERPFDRREYRKSPLFDRFLTFHLGGHSGPGGAG